MIAYVGYFYPGVSLGPRYYFEALGPLALAPLATATTHDLLKTEALRALVVERSIICRST